MIVFAHNQKTAGTTFKYILRANYGINHCQTAKSKKRVFKQSDLNRARKVFPNLKSILGHNVFAPTEHLEDRDLFFATILREPRARMASHYQDHCLRGNYQGSFHEWIQEFPDLHDVQVRRVAGEPNLDKAKYILAEKYDYVGLTEDFNEALKLFKVLCPFPINIDYNKRNEAVSTNIKEHVQNEEHQLLEQSNELDIALYHFAKTEIYEKLIQKHKSAIQQTDEPKIFPSSYKPFHFRASKFYNNVIYSFTEKVARNF